MIFGFGTAAFDYRIQVADFGANYTEKLLAKKTEMFHGGATANCLVQAARLGAKTAYLGKLGNDRISKAVVQALKNEKINTKMIIYDRNEYPPFNVAVYTENSGKRIGGFLLPNSLNSIGLKDINHLSKPIQNGDLVICEIGEIPLLTVFNFIKKCKTKGAILIADIDLAPLRQCNGGSRSLLKKIIMQLDFLIPNFTSLADMYPKLSKKDMVKALFNRYKIPCIITAGKSGVFYTDMQGKIHCLNSLAEQVVDSVGAGDAFHGGFIFGIAKGMNIHQAVLAGSICAAENCKKAGAREGMPRKKVFFNNFAVFSRQLSDKYQMSVDYLRKY